MRKGVSGKKQGSKASAFTTAALETGGEKRPQNTGLKRREAQRREWGHPETWPPPATPTNFPSCCPRRASEE